MKILHKMLLHAKKSHLYDVLNYFYSSNEFVMSLIFEIRRVLFKLIDTELLQIELVNSSC